LDTAYRSFDGEVEASSTPTICRPPDSRRHQLSAIAPLTVPMAAATTLFIYGLFDRVLAIPWPQTVLGVAPLRSRRSQGCRRRIWRELLIGPPTISVSTTLAAFPINAIAPSRSSALREGRYADWFGRSRPLPWPLLTVATAATERVTSITAFPELLQRLQEGGEVAHLCRRKPDIESLIVEIHHVQQRCGRAVVEVRCTPRQPAQNRSLHFADIRTFARN
jgi:hypothetical protein